jgi:hypothetical protein
METKTLYNINMHFEHVQWKNELAFWTDELKSFNNRLSELVTRWTDKDVLTQLEHFQNEFILHGGVIEDIEETINKHEISISNNSDENHESMNVYMTKNHLELRDKLETQRQVYADLKKEFFKFLSKYM